MKATVDRDTLAALVAKAKGTAGRKSTLPILGSVLLRAGDGAIHLRSTDLAVTVRSHVMAWVDEPGEALLSFKGLTKAL